MKDRYPISPEVLGEMVKYYSARAGEYEDWWERRGRYEMAEDARRRWFAEREQVYRAFDSLCLSGDVLELAPGTGVWTRRLVHTADRLTALDASAEMLAINRASVQSPKVDYIVADIFSWKPVRVFDAAVFGFWISHVPIERLDGFLAWLACCLRPGGIIFFIDQLRETTSTAVDHILPSESEQIAVRKLNDGRSFRIVKTFYESQELTARFEQAGFEVEVRYTPTFFYYGVGKRT